MYYNVFFRLAPALEKKFCSQNICDVELHIEHPPQTVCCPEILLYYNSYRNNSSYSGVSFDDGGSDDEEGKHRSGNKPTTEAK